MDRAIQLAQDKLEMITRARVLVILLAASALPLWGQSYYAGNGGRADDN